MKVLQVRDPLKPEELKKMVDYCLKNKDRINSYYNSKTPLMQAIDAEDLETVKILVSHGADPICQITKAISPLCRCIQLDNYPLTKYLIEIGANTCFRGAQNKTPLFWAIQTENIPLISLLLENGATFTLFDNLVSAIEKRNVDIVRELIRHGADVNRRDHRGHIPLMSAVHEKSLELVILLHENGANLDARNIHNLENPIIKSIRLGATHIFKYLISKGVDLNQKTKSGLTALSQAALAGDLEVFKTLVEAGADLKTVSYTEIQQLVAMNPKMKKFLKYLGTLDKAESAKTQKEGEAEEPKGLNLKGLQLGNASTERGPD